VAETATSPLEIPTNLPTSTPVLNITTPPPAPSQQADAILARLTTKEKIGQMILIGLGGKELTQTECQIIQDITPGGIVFHGGNVSDPSQLSNLIDSIKNCAGQSSTIPLFFAIDHEGQYINRFKTGGATVFPSPQAVGATGDPAYAFKVAFASGQEIASFGINMVLGPVADVLIDLDNTVIGERSFGGDANKVAAFTDQAVQGYRQAGLIPVLKHFPGHGASSIDSHLGLPVDQSTSQSLFIDHLPPFIQGLAAGAPVVMTGHTALPRIDSRNFPASLSGPVIGILRNDLGFNGVVITDSLDMGALQSTGLDSAGVALAAALAGNDMLLILSSSDAKKASVRLLSSLDTGEISIDQVNASVRRILSLKEANDLLNGYPAVGYPDFAANQTIANEVGQHSVAIIKNDDAIIPVSAAIGNILLVVPPDAWQLNVSLANALRDKGHTVTVAEYTAPWIEAVGTEAEIQSIHAQANNSDMVIVLTWQAHTNKILYNDDWQGRMVRDLQQGNAKIIVAALKSPTDLLEFPSQGNFVCTFGTTPAQLDSLVNIITGDLPAYGVNPLPGLP
jgi:beta-N-acetylhexosaminidase